MFKKEKGIVDSSSDHFKSLDFEEERVSPIKAQIRKTLPPLPSNQKQNHGKALSSFESAPSYLKVDPQIGRESVVNVISLRKDLQDIWNNEQLKFSKEEEEEKYSFNSTLILCSRCKLNIYVQDEGDSFIQVKKGKLVFYLHAGCYHCFQCGNRFWNSFDIFLIKEEDESKKLICKNCDDSKKSIPQHSSEVLDPSG
jgi:hypothetical protein